MNIFLSGGNSFIGRNLQEQLKYNFVAPPHKALDLTNTQAVEDFFKQTQFDAVIHLASDNSEGELKDVYESANMKMFVNLVMQKGHYNKLINIGSGAEYGKQDPILMLMRILKENQKTFMVLLSTLLESI